MVVSGRDPGHVVGNRPGAGGAVVDSGCSRDQN